MNDHYLIAMRYISHGNYQYRDWYFAAVAMPRTITLHKEEKIISCTMTTRRTAYDLIIRVGEIMSQHAELR